MAKNKKKYLLDIITAIEGIQNDHLDGIHSLDDFLKNNTAQKAVERELGIIGEAIYQANKIDKNLSITRKDYFINFRNTIIHQYADVSVKRIWQIVHYDLPSLKSEVLGIL
ncbi:MAG: DUF86 domain-containing protein [Bacteroidetes bacterium]|nr:DUF86 domain-containing protein [Bacteroidota bacterium]